MALLLSTLLLAADASSGQGADPDKGPGVALIIGIVVLVALVLAVLWWFIVRRPRTRPQPEGTHDRGDVGRI
jgi:hypothetical protein